ncbi:cyclic nucleotide-binding domain-containing protein [Candidatus Neomarinimicrobiota bacterium]
MSTITIKDLTNFDLLKGLAESERLIVGSKLTEKRYPAGKTIFQEGDPGGEIFFLITGEIEISQALTLSMSKSTTYDTRDKSIIKLSGENGPVFGEVAIFGNEESRTATVTALTDCRIGVLPKNDFFEILVTNHELGYKIMLNLTRIVCGRLIDSNKNVLKLTTALSLILEN